MDRYGIARYSNAIMGYSKNKGLIVSSLKGFKIVSLSIVIRRRKNPKVVAKTNCRVKLFFFKKTAGTWEPPRKLTTANP